MSIQDFFSFDSANVGDFLSDPIGAFKKIINSFYDGNSLFSTDEFAAVALTNGVEIDAEEAIALGFAVADDRISEETFYKFKARTIAKDGPHIILTDPCVLTDKMTEEERCLRNSLIAAHSTVVYSTNSGQVNIGNVVTVKFSRNSDDTLNLRQGRLVNFINSDNDYKTLTPEACEFIEALYEFGDAYVAPPPIVMNGEIEQLALDYDTSNYIKFKSINNRQMEGLLKPFDSFVKAFIIEAKNQLDIDIKITSAVRTYEEQKNQFNKWVRGGKVGIRPADPDRNQGSFASYHEVGLAVDFNFFKDSVFYGSHRVAFQGRDFPKDENGVVTEAGKQQHKNIWIGTRIPSLIDRLGLHWGGNFTSNYDPIHIQLNYQNYGIEKEQVYQAFKTGTGLDIRVADPTSIQQVGIEQAQNETFTESFINELREQQRRVGNQYSSENISESQKRLLEAETEPEDEYLIDEILDG